MRAIDLIRRGIDPSTYRRQMQQGEEPPPYPADFQPSKEHLEDLHRLLLDPEEIERRLENGQDIPDWALDHYARTKGRADFKRAQDERQEIRQDLRSKRMSLPQYMMNELQAMTQESLVAIARNYPEYIQENALTAETPPQTLVKIILSAQELYFAQNPDELDVEPEMPILDELAPGLAEKQVALNDKQAERVREERMKAIKEKMADPEERSKHLAAVAAPPVAAQTEEPAPDPAAAPGEGFSDPGEGEE